MKKLLKEKLINVNQILNEKNKRTVSQYINKVNKNISDAGSSFYNSEAHNCSQFTQKSNVKHNSRAWSEDFSKILKSIPRIVPNISKLEEFYNKNISLISSSCYKPNLTHSRSNSVSQIRPFSLSRLLTTREQKRLNNLCYKGR